VRWQSKALIQRTASRLPRGDRAYRHLQRRFGTAWAAPDGHIAVAAAMARDVRAAGIEIGGATCCEVGTGHKPTIPIALHLAGAAHVFTVDLHRRLQPDLTGGVLRWLGEHVDDVVAALADVAEPGLEARIAAAAAGAIDPVRWMADAGIDYVAPADAAALPWPDDTVDVHLSHTVLEHIEPVVLGAILREARRVVRPGGAVVHHVDLADHFAHDDATICSINFLRYDAATWARLAGNEFSYCNRLRLPELRDAFAAAGLATVREEWTVDARSVAELAAGFAVHADFAGFTADELCCDWYRVLATPERVGTAPAVGAKSVADDAVPSPH